MLRFQRRGGHRGGRMGHGGPVRGGPMPPPPAPPPVPVHHQPNNFPGQNQNPVEIPFDIAFCSEIFPRATPEPDESLLTAALLQRNTEVTPSVTETQAMQNLVTRIQTIIENIILSPGTFTACQVDEIRQVGSFKQGTILAGHLTADLVVILKTFPTKDAVDALHAKVAEELKETDCLRSSSTAHGFDLSNLQGTVRILITTVVHNMRKLDPTIHLDAKIMNEHWQAIKHSRWVEENANSSTIKVLIRILRDMRSRIPAFKPLPPAKLDLLAHFAVTNTAQMQPLPLAAAFRRVMSLMSTGLFLPPYANTSMRGVQLSQGDADRITAAAQLLVLVIAQGGYEAALGTKQDKDIFNTPTKWNGVIIQPPQKVVLVEDNAVQDMEIEESDLPSPN